MNWEPVYIKRLVSNVLPTASSLAFTFQLFIPAAVKQPVGPATSKVIAKADNSRLVEMYNFIQVSLNAPFCPLHLARF